MKKYLEIFIKKVTPIIILGVIYIQIKSELPTLSNDLQKIDITYNSVWFLCFNLLLMFVNWFLEALKWKILIAEVKHISMVRALKAILNGLAFGLFTPFRVGDAITRIAHIDDKNKSIALGSVFIARSSQLISTLIFGVIALFLFDYLQVINTFFLILIIFISIIIYFKMSVLLVLLQKIKWIDSYIKYIKIIETYTTNDLIIALSLSFIRYGVIIFQYYLMFLIFNIDISFFNVIIGVAITLLVKSILPILSVAGDFGVREVVAIYIFSFFDIAAVQILMVTVSIWLINVVFPSLVGAFLTKNFKLTP